MEKIDSFLEQNSKLGVQHRTRVAQLDWNVVLRCLLNLRELKIDPHDIETAQFLTQMMYLDKDQRKELSQLIANVPLPTTKVIITPVASDGIMRRQTQIISCTTVLELLQHANGCVDFRGWPVPRRVGQNVGRYHANKGLCLRVEYPSSLDFQK